VYKKNYKLFKILLILITITTFSLLGYPVNAQTASQTYTWKNVQIGGGGGFIPGIIYSQKEKDLIYARTDMGGAYRWDPANKKWIQLLDWAGQDDYSLYGCDSLAADPVDANRVYIAAGMYTNSWSKTNGYILRSTDKGNTWQKTELPFKFGGNMPGRGMGERLVVDPNKNNILYFGTRCGNGLWRSTDYGATWSKVESFPNPGTYVYDATSDYGKDIIGVVWEAFDTTSSTSGTATKNIYVGVADKDNSIYRSTDGGATWSAVPGQPTGLLPHHGVIGSNGQLYITYSNTCGPYDGTKGDVWKYDTKTGVWTNISPVPSSSTDDYFGYGGLAVDAQHPDTLIVSALNSWWPDTRFYRSTDSGKTWTPIWDWAGYPNRTLNYTQDVSAAPWLNLGNNPQPPEPALKLGWMVDAIAIDPFNSNNMMYGTGATIYGTDNLTDWDNGGKINLTVKATGIEECAVQALISPPTGTAHLISAVGDDAGFKHDNLDAVQTKEMISIYDTINSIDYAESTPNFMTAVGSSKNKDTKLISYTYDGGGNWFQGNVPASGVSGGIVAVGADTKSILWAPKDSVPYISTNTGNSWAACIGLPKNALVCSDRVNAKKFYAFSAGTFYTSIDGGVTFTATAATGLPVELGTSLKAVTGNEGDVWLAAHENGLWHSTDGGNTFTKVDSAPVVNVVGFGKAADGKTYPAIYMTGKVDGVAGFFRSDDEGSTWVRINDDQHQYGATDSAITGDPRIYGRVYIGTNGRGIVYGDISIQTILYGDVNKDGKINSVDSAIIKRYVSGTIDNIDKTFADLNGDGTINSLDCSLMKRFLNGLITKFPVDK
jgi:xyloglucan-specific exo-beta-1,4-glucanase